MGARKAVTVEVHGRVQGVAFRYSCEVEARRRGVAGWVRNEPDGSVAAHFEGPADAVDAMVSWCRQGPPGARVQRVTVVAAAESGAGDFRVRF